MSTMRRYALLAVLALGLGQTISAEPLAPFGTDVVAAAKPGKPAKSGVELIDCFSATLAPKWSVETPLAGQKDKPFAVVEEDGKKVLRLSLDLLDPAKTTVRILLPGDGPANGDVWNKNGGSNISFLCKSTKPAQMTFHLLQRGQGAGTFRAKFSAQPGEWKKITLPVQGFGLPSFAKVAGLGIRLAAADKDTEVSIADISVGGMLSSDTKHFSASLKGDWHFAPDAGEQGTTDKWYAEEFNDDKWQVLKAGQPWEKQGVEHHGYGWYRQKLLLPSDIEGTPLTLTLADIPNEDDVWFNGVRVGGIRGEYKYANMAVRTYTVAPALIHYGKANTIAIRAWGGNCYVARAGSGLVPGVYTAEADANHVLFRPPGGEEMAAELFDLTDAQRGKAFEIVVPLPADILKGDAGQLEYTLVDFYKTPLKTGGVALAADKQGVLRAVVAIDQETAQKIYFAGRVKLNLDVKGKSGESRYVGVKELDHLCFAKRDSLELPPLAERTEDTPYGKLKLVDEIDCAASLNEDPHPYLQSGYDAAQLRMTPGSPVNVKVSEILGKKARESDYGWFAYRIGRGKLKVHTMYLVRMEYPEDKPRYAPVDIQAGLNYMDIGWKNGVATDDPYDNWPLSHKWQWYDAVVPLDDMTLGSGGTRSAAAETGFWIYFQTKVNPGRYFAMYAGGPAIARIKLYEIDPDKNAPVIERPKNLPNRVLSVDWEKEPDHPPADMVSYAKLMGYSAISPLTIKWAGANWAEPLNGYSTFGVDARGYTVISRYDPATGKAAEMAVAGKPSIHTQYLAATKKGGIDYIPRFEYGGSLDLPKETWAIGPDGKTAKPDRFNTWCGDLLNPATWDDLQKLMDHLIKPYVKDNPQMTGALWRIRENRMPISYSKADIEMFAKETNTSVPPGSEQDLTAWAAGAMKEKYDDWWHQKRAQFHARLVELLKSYRPDMTLYYYNWDEDKFSLFIPDIHSAAYYGEIAAKGGLVAYKEDCEARAKFTGADYIRAIRTGDFSGGATATRGLKIPRTDYAVRPELYKGIKGMQLFAPAGYLCYADKPDYLNYFQTADGLAMSNLVSYDELGMRAANPKFEGNMVTPGGPAFSMAMELLAYFHGDARTLNYTVYTFGRGFADAHRRFAQAFLALPAIEATVVEQGDKDLKVRVYAAGNAAYVGVAYKGYAAKTLTIRVPAKAGATITNLVTNAPVSTTPTGGDLQFDIESGPMELNAFLVH